MPLPSREEIEKALEAETSQGIMELSSSVIKQQKNDILQRLQIARERLKYYHETLKRYRYIDNINDLVVGNYIRWLNLRDPTSLQLTNGAYIADFKETDTTIYIVCKTSFGRFFSVDVNTCLIFQKLNHQEETILAVINYLEK